DVIAGGERGGPAGGDVLEQLLLMRGVGLHHGDELRDEIGAALQLHVDVGPTVPGHLQLGYEPVVEHDAGDERDGDEGKDDDGGESARLRCLAIALHNAPAGATRLLETPARFMTRSSTTPGSASVLVSPRLEMSFSAILRRMRRMILPLRVFG